MFPVYTFQKQAIAFSKMSCWWECPKIQEFGWGGDQEWEKALCPVTSWNHSIKLRGGQKDTQIKKIINFGYVDGSQSNSSISMENQRITYNKPMVKYGDILSWRNFLIQY